MIRVMTVCTGNICRSPMAEYQLRRSLEREGLEDEVEVTSSGTSRWEVGNPIDPRAAARLEEAGIDASAHRARRFRPSWFTDLDLVLAMDVDHLDELREIAPDPDQAEKVVMFRQFVDDAAGTDPQNAGIADPWYGGDADFDATYDLIDEALPSLVGYIREQLPTGTRRA